MDDSAILIIAIGLGMDAFSVAISVGAIDRKLTFWPVFRLSGSFGFFQFVMPIAGWLAGIKIANLIEDYDHWIAFILLAYVGVKMIWESIQGKDRISTTDPTKGLTLVMLSVATSIDALAVGLSFAFLNIPIIHASIVIGVVAIIMTTVGMLFGKKLGALFGKKAELIGGIVLFGIGLKILLDHMN